MVERPSPTIRLGRIGRKFCPPPHLHIPWDFVHKLSSVVRAGPSTAQRALTSKLAYDPLSALVRYTDSPTVDASARHDATTATIVTAGSAVSAAGS